MNNFDFCKQIDRNTFIRVKYEKSTSYLFFDEMHDNLVYSLSVLNEHPHLLNFEEVVRYFCNKLGKGGTWSTMIRQR